MEITPAQDMPVVVLCPRIAPEAHAPGCPYRHLFIPPQPGEPGDWVGTVTDLDEIRERFPGVLFHRCLIDALRYGIAHANRIALCLDAPERITMATIDGITLPHGWKITSRLLAGWSIDDQHLLELWPESRTGEGRIRWYYRLSRHNQTIFAASDICSAVGALLSTTELVQTARTVLTFLTVCPGDTDSEYFDAYTATQLEWRDCYAEELSIYTLADLCGYCGEDHISPGCPRR